MNLLLVTEHPFFFHSCLADNNPCPGFSHLCFPAHTGYLWTWRFIFYIQWLPDTQWGGHTTQTSCTGRHSSHVEWHQSWSNVERSGRFAPRQGCRECQAAFGFCKQPPDCCGVCRTINLHYWCLHGWTCQVKHSQYGFNSIAATVINCILKRNVTSRIPSSYMPTM